MSMVASDIGTIPASGFNWYVLFLQDDYDDPINYELSSNFLVLGREVGRDVLVVRGYDSNEFYTSTYEAITLYDVEWQDKMARPALLISDTAPRLLLQERAKLHAAKLILIPLAPFRTKPQGSVIDLLRRLVTALKDEDAVNALTALEPNAFKRGWGWLSRYAELKPNFMGFGVNLKPMIDDILS